MLNKIKSMILKWLFNNSIQYKNLIDGNLTTKEYVRCSYPKALQEDIKALEHKIDSLDDSTALAVRMCKVDYEGLQESHNKLGCEVTLLNDEYMVDNDDSPKEDIKRCFEKINTLNDKVDNHINLGS